MMLENGEVVTAGPGGKPSKKRKAGEPTSKPNGTAKPTAATSNGTTTGSMDVGSDEKKPAGEAKAPDAKGDTAMADATDEHRDDDAEEDGHDDDEDHEMNGTKEKAEGETAEAKLYYDDDFDEEGAIWPIEEGRIANWEAFFALLLVFIADAILNPPC